MTTYKITDMRVVSPTAKVAERNPDRVLTVYGKFHTDKGVLLSFTSKAVNRDDALHPEFAIDLAKGILTLHEGERGRKETPSISQDAVNDLLASIKAND